MPLNYSHMATIEICLSISAMSVFGGVLKKIFPIKI